MTSLLIAQSDFDRWTDIIMMVLVVGGSVLAAVSKKLIEYFRSREPQKRSRPPRAGHTGAETGMPGLGSAPVAGRRAKPFPAGPVPQEPKVRPVARPYPSFPVRPATSAKRRGVRSVGGRPPVPGTAKPVPKTKPRRAAPVRGREARAPLEPTARVRLGHLHPVVEDRAEQVDAEVAQRMGHLGTTVTSGTLMPREPSRERHEAARRNLLPSELATRAGLRRAVVLREILGLPVSLRRFDDLW